MTSFGVQPSAGPSTFLQSAVYPALPLIGLTDDEHRAANALAMRLFGVRPYLELRGLYYDGLQKMQSLGISIPPSLEGLRTIMGWPQIGVDVLDERCIVEGFRYRGDVDFNDELLDLWRANQMPLESSLGHLDAFIHGRAYVMVGTNDEDPEHPLITVESPLNMIAVWDARLRKVTAALQLYLNTDWSSDLYSREVAALYLPGTTIHMTRDVSPDGVFGKWEVIGRDNHGFPDPPVLRLANRQRTTNREGASEITPAWMNTTDSACRTLLGMEVGREFHAAPRRYVLGASEENFKKADGTAISAWDTYMGKIWGLERDEEGNLPQVGQFAPSDPSVYTKLLDTYRQDMAAIMGVPAHFLGVATQGNPASADAIRADEARLIKRAERKHLAFGQTWVDVLTMALTIRDGEPPEDAHMIECDWQDPATPTPGATTDALQKQVASGMVAPRSDVILRRAGYSPMEIAQLRIDYRNDAAQQQLAELANSLQAKEAKADTTVAKDSQPASAGSASSRIASGSDSAAGK